jgi:exopolyphosphatase
VIDHHDEEHKVPHDTQNEPRIIEKAGSCTSLVTNYCSAAWDLISSQALSTGGAVAQDDARGLINDQAYSSTWDAQIAKVALASILIDTSNLRSKDKVTKHDIEATAYLEAKIVASPQISKDFDRNTFYQEIAQAKLNIGRLRIHDILRKDYKQWSEGSKALGVSSVVKNIDFLMDKAKSEDHGEEASQAFLQAVDTFAKDRGLDMYAVMTTSTSAEGHFQRELYLSAVNADTIKSASKFEQESTAELGLSEWHGSSQVNLANENCWRKIWQQHELQHSRKRVAPLLRQSLGA